MSNTKQLFQELVEVIAALRHPETGCPWDLEQTHETLKPYIVEETYEVLEAIESKDDDELCKELGDLLLQVVLHAQVAKDRNAFSIDNIIEAITSKMIRRHPHVFGETKAKDSKEVLKNWEAIKYEERSKENKGEKNSILTGVPSAMPALLRAQRLGERASKVSFDWESPEGVWKKVQEEYGELQDEIEKLPSNGKPDDKLKALLQHEIGDLLFVLCQLSRWLDLSAETCLRICSTRFTKRFHLMEEASSHPLSQLSEQELTTLWEKAKQNSSPLVPGSIPKTKLQNSKTHPQNITPP